MDSLAAIIKDAENRMHHAVEVTAHDFGRIRTGRANPQLVEKITVEYYGVETPINQVANISVPEARQLLISPFDKSVTKAIEAAILKSDLGVNPNNDGQSIRLNFPPMTEDRRKELVKQVHHRAEEGRVAIRNVRRDALHHAHEDEVKAFEKRLQDLTDKYVHEVDGVQKKKDAEVMEI
jgi:ribosome recycling factor